MHDLHNVPPPNPRSSQGPCPASAPGFAALQAFWLALLLALFAPPARAAVVQMSNEEIIQRSKLIFVGTVLDKKARWNDKGNLILTDYRFKVEDVLYGKAGAELTLTLAGGQLPEEGQSVSDVPEFSVGERMLLMVEDSETPLLSPVTGMHQGYIPAAAIPKRWNVVRPDGTNTPFRDLVERIRRQIPEAKSKPLPDRKTVPEALRGAILRDLPSKVYDASDTGAPSPDEIVLPRANPERDSHNPAAPEPPNYVTDQPDPAGSGQAPSYWSYSHRAKNVPIVFNPLPSGGLIGDHDQYQMAYWNDYGDIYRVMASTGTWAWQNNRYDIAGFVDNATMIAQFGAGWGSSTLAVCWLRWDGTGFSIEADIAVNPAWNWTTDDYSTYSNSNLHNADHTLLHEIGHSWGLEHQFNALSVMNYAPHKYRAYTVLYGDDTMAIRAAFPGNAISRTDLGVSLFYSAAYQDWDDSNLSSTSVPRGSSFTVSNFVLENPGTATVSVPEVNWYLVPAINSWSGAIFLGTTTHSSLAGDSYFLTSRTLTIPSNTAIGSYYLGAYVGYNASDSISDNDSSWLDRIINVTCPSLAAPTGIAATDGTLCGVVRVSWNAVSGATGYNVYRDGVFIASDTASPYDDNPGNTSTHSYTVRATNGCGTSASGTANNGYAGGTPPVPTGVAATDGTFCGVVRVSWNAASGATSYDVYRDGVFVANDAASPYDDSPGNTSNHSYTVRARNGCGVSSASSANSGYAGSVPGAPTGVAATDGTLCGTVRVSWNAVSGATSYDVYRDGVFVANDAASPYDDAPGNTANHSYTVRARNGCGAGGASAANTGYALGAPSAPTGVAATDGTIPCIVRVSWNASAGATSYDVYRGATLLASVAASPYDDNPGDTGVHSYTVRAKNGCGTSGASAADNGSAGVCSACTGTELVTSFTPGSLRNNAGGYRGLRLRVGAAPMQVCALGRVYVNGNSQSHELILSDSAGTLLASATWTPAGGVHNQIKYVDLAATVTLAANTEYYLGSAEVPGGDSWYNFNTLVTTASDASVLSAAYNAGAGWADLGGAENSYVPVSLKYTTSTQTLDCRDGWVRSFTPGTLRNNAGGYRGLRLRVGANPMQVCALGRVYVNGNSQSHELVLANSAGTVVASATWTPAGGVHNQIKYADLGSPVTLSANTEYYLGSAEVSGGDSWYNYNTLVTTTAEASVLSAAYQTGGGWVDLGGANQSYVPVSLRCCSEGPCTPNTGLVSAFAPGTLRNNAGGYRGLRLRTGAQPLQVSALGRVYVNGNNQPHELVLTDTAGTVVASATWTPAGGVHNQIKYVALGAPVALAANTDYYLGSAETPGGDSWYNFNTVVTPGAGVSVLSAAYNTSGSWVDIGGANTSYLPVSLWYCAGGGGGGCTDTDWVTGIAPGALRNNAGGYRGLKLRTGAAPVEVTGLGRVFVNGNSQSHELVLVHAASGVTVASATWTPAGGVHGQIKHVALPASVTLPPNTDYFLGSAEESGGDSWYNYNTVLTTTGAASVLSAAYNTGASWFEVGGADYSYVPVGLQYCAPNPASGGSPVSGAWLDPVPVREAVMALRVHVPGAARSVEAGSYVVVEGETYILEVRLGTGAWVELGLVTGQSGSLDVVDEQGLTLQATAYRLVPVLPVLGDPDA